MKKIINERPVTRCVTVMEFVEEYLTFDGKIFTNREDAERHELYEKYLNILNLKRLVNDIHEEWLYPVNLEEVEIILEFCASQGKKVNGSDIIKEKEWVYILWDVNYDKGTTWYKFISLQTYLDNVSVLVQELEDLENKI